MEGKNVERKRDKEKEREGGKKEGKKELAVLVTS